MGPTGGDVPAPNGAGLSKSAASRRCVALSAERMKEWMASDLSKLDLLVIQIVCRDLHPTFACFSLNRTVIGRAKHRVDYAAGCLMGKNQKNARSMSRIKNGSSEGHLDSAATA